jgi:hypothetical protein
MISCPICGAKTRVAETRVSATSARRRRVCTAAACAGKVTTIEVVIPEGRGHFFGKGSVIVSADLLAKLRELIASIKGIDL